MGKRGPQKTPTKMLEARGSWRANGRDAEPEPEPISGADCPEWIPELGQKWWPQICNELAAMNVLTTADLLAVGLLVDSLAQWLEYREVVKRDGVFLTHPQSGHKILHPAYRASKDAWEQVLKVSREFGMTPASRANLSVSKETGSGGKKDKSRFFK